MPPKQHGSSDTGHSPAKNISVEIKRPDRPPDIPVIEFFEIWRRQPLRINNQNFPGDGFESGSEMMRRLDRNNGLFFRLDALGSERGKIQRLQPNA